MRRRFFGSNTIYIGVYSKTFYKECADGGSGSAVTVTQDDVGGPFTSKVSQEDANNKAKAAVEEVGQDYANKNGDCTWTGRASQTFQKQCTDGGEGSYISVNESMVTGGPFTSNISQEDANTKARAAVSSQGQQIANQRGTCTWTGSYSRVFTTQCGSGGVGSKVTVSQNDVSGAPFTSTISQDEANSKAKYAVDSQGQSVANSRGYCTWTGTYSKTFTKECADGGAGSSVTVTQDDVSGAPFTSNISMEDAYNKAKAAVDAQGQEIANEEGTCTWTGSYSREFTKSCTGDGVGSTMTVTQDDVEGAPFTSTVSKADADSKAKSAVDSKGQAVANAEGTCTWTGTYSKTFYRDDDTCSSCYHGGSITVDQDDMDGAPFTSTVSKTDANNKAKEAVLNGGQAYANSHASCIADDTSASWTDTGSTRCNGCTSQKQQKDTNSCSSTYNTTKWVSGGGRSCSNWQYYGSGDCVGHTQYDSYRDSCSGSVDNQYSVSCYDCCNCGSYSATTEYRCSGTTRQRKYTDDCGNVDWRTYQTNSPDCGGCTCSLSVSGVSVGYSGGTKKASVTSTCGSTSISYSASSNQSWCSTSVVSGGVNVTCTANSSHSSRSATVTVTQTGGNCSSSKTFTVSQDGKPNDYVFTIVDGTTSKTYSVAAGGTSNHYTITSTKNGASQGWSVTDNASWLTASRNGSVMEFTVQANTSSSSRSGTITLTQDESGKTISVTIAQAGVEAERCYYSPTGVVRVMSQTGSQATLEVTLNIEKTGNPVDNSVRWSIVCGNNSLAYGTVPTTLFSNKMYTWTETVSIGACGYNTLYNIVTSMVNATTDCK